MIKKSITEKEAAESFVSLMLKEGKEVWPLMLKIIETERVDARKLIMCSEPEVLLALVAMGQEMSALYNLLPKQAKHIQSLMYEALSRFDNGSSYIRTVEKYFLAYKNSARDLTNPLSTCVSNLLLDLFGQNNHHFELLINNEPTGEHSPLMGAQIVIVLNAFAGKWKDILEKYEITSDSYSSR